jgi:hypothetical protein
LSRHRKSRRKGKRRLFNPNRLPGMRIVVEDAGGAAVVAAGVLVQRQVVLPSKLNHLLL